MGTVLKRVVTVAMTLTTPEKYPRVVVFSGPRRRFVRPSDCFVAILLVLFPHVLSDASVCASGGLQLTSPLSFWLSSVWFWSLLRLLVPILGHLFVFLPMSSFSVLCSAIVADCRCYFNPLSALFCRRGLLTVVLFLLLLFGTRLFL